MNNNDSLLTLGAIAKELGLRLHQAKYLMDNHAPPPARRMGIVRVWERSDLPALRKQVARMAARREVTNHA